MVSNYARLARKLASLSRRERADLLRAQWELIAALAAVRLRPTGSFAASQGEPGAGDPASLPEARSLALAVTRAARFGVIRPQCLVRSIALTRLLDARGIRGAVLRVGVRRTHGEFEAHAWVELAGETLGDVDEHVGSFAPLTTIELRQG